MKLCYALLFVPLFMANSLSAQTGTFTQVTVNNPVTDGGTYSLKTLGSSWLGGSLLVKPEVSATNPNTLIRLQPVNAYTGSLPGVNSCFDLVDNYNVGVASFLQFGIDNTGTWLGDFKSAFIASTTNGGVAKDLKLFAGDNPFSGNIGICLKANTQNVGIGTADTKGYKLAVAGSVVAESVKVKLIAQWPDYVFNEAYKLPSLQEVEKYVSEHKHLMDMPSAEEIKKEGQDLGDMNRRLLQKVEELTLYLIDLKKQQTALEEKNTTLQERVAELESRK